MRLAATLWLSIVVGAVVGAGAVGACGRGDDSPRPSQPPAAREAAGREGSAANPSANPEAGAAVVFHPPGRPPARVAVEVAVLPHQIQRGLMYREHLRPDAGMIFLFRSSKVQRFWMKNTLVSLDMIFVASDRKVVGVVERTEPRTLTSRNVAAPSQFVVEVNGGWAAAHGITAGVPVTFENVPVDRATVD
jgi:uncharacterized protein